MYVWKKKGELADLGGHFYIQCDEIWKDILKIFVFFRVANQRALMSGSEKSDIGVEGKKRNTFPKLTS